MKLITVIVYFQVDIPVFLQK